METLIFSQSIARHENTMFACFAKH